MGDPTHPISILQRAPALQQIVEGILGTVTSSWKHTKHFKKTKALKSPANTENCLTCLLPCFPLDLISRVLVGGLCFIFIGTPGKIHWKIETLKESRKGLLLGTIIERML